MSTELDKVQMIIVGWPWYRDDVQNLVRVWPSHHAPNMPPTCTSPRFLKTQTTDIHHPDLNSGNNHLGTCHITLNESLPPLGTKISCWSRPQPRHSSEPPLSAHWVDLNNAAVDTVYTACLPLVELLMGIYVEYQVIGCPILKRQTSCFTFP